MHRRVTGRLQEGYQSVREGYRSVREGNRKCTRGLPEFALECRSRDSYVWEGSGGLLEVGRLQVKASLGLQIMLYLLAYSTPSHCPPPRAHQNATGGKFSAPTACSPVHREDPLKPTGIPIPHHGIVHINQRVTMHGNGPLNP